MRYRDSCKRKSKAPNLSNELSKLVNPETKQFIGYWKRPKAGVVNKSMKQWLLNYHRLTVPTYNAEQTTGFMQGESTFGIGRQNNYKLLRSSVERTQNHRQIHL